MSECFRDIINGKSATKRPTAILVIATKRGLAPYKLYSELIPEVTASIPRMRQTTSSVSFVFMRYTLVQIRF